MDAAVKKASIELRVTNVDKDPIQIVWFDILIY